MNTVHPMLTNILALADMATWQKSIDLADEALSNWLKQPRKFERVILVGHGMDCIHFIDSREKAYTVSG